MIRVLIVDDSALVRAALQEMIERHPDLEVVATASDPYFARDRLRSHDPDVVILDVEMPRMDGLTFLKKLMAHRPRPVVMFSSHTENGARTTLEALEAGAVDFVTKPREGNRDALLALEERLIEKVRAAARARPKRLGKTALEVEQRLTIDDVLDKRLRAPAASGHEPVVCLGASTGGTVAIERLLRQLPKDSPAMLIVQHMPAGFTAAFAARTNQLAQMEVREARDGDRLRRGLVLIAPGGRHLLLQRSSGHSYASVREGPRVNRHRPSVDVLFRSAANSLGSRAIGVLLTGMGDDGAVGLKDLHDTGAVTLAQDESSSVVFGMPKAAIALGAVDRVLTLDGIAVALMRVS